MADSTVTRRALTSSFRELISEVPFSKISVGDICEKCNMNRKSFYYHYRDKYDLANSIFDTEFPYLCSEGTVDKDLSVIRELCRYLYLNKLQYRRLFETEGQNSFYDHLREILRIYFYKRLRNKNSFSAGFWADAVSLSIKEWMLSKKSIHYDDFYRQLISCIRIDGQVS